MTPLGVVHVTKQPGEDLAVAMYFSQLAAMTSQALGTPYAQGGALATSIREWVGAVWPSLRLRPRTALELALSRVTEGHQLLVSPSGEKIAEDVSGASSSTAETCFHGCNPRMLADILQNGLKPSVGKHDILGIWTSPHIHTAVGYPMSLKEAVPVTNIGPAIRVILKIEAEPSCIIKRIPGKKNKQGLPVNYQWPLREEGHRVVAVHIWCYDAHAAPHRELDTLNIAQAKKERALQRDADALISVIPEDERERQEMDVEQRMKAPKRIPPKPRRPQGSVGEALLKLRKRLKRQKQWVRRHRARIEAMGLPQPPAATSA